MPAATMRTSRWRTSWVQLLPFGLTLAAASVLAIGMGWPTSWAGQRASLVLEPYHLKGDLGAPPGSAGGFALGWLATDTATAVVTPVATDTAVVTTPGPNTQPFATPDDSDQGPSAGAQATTTAPAGPLTPVTQPTITDPSTPTPGQSAPTDPTQASASPQALPTATPGAGLADSPDQTGSAPVAPADQPAQALSDPAQSAASSATRGEPPSPDLGAPRPPRAFDPGLVLIGLGVVLIGLGTASYLLRKHRTPP